MPIGTLGDDVDAGSLPPSTYRDGTTALTIGIDFAVLSPVGLEVPDGEHVLVAGPARSGRSTALIRLIAGWCDAHHDGVVVLALPADELAGGRLGEVVDAPTLVAAVDEESIVATVGGGVRRVLVAVDDAERVADAGGGLAALVAERHPNVTVVATGRPDALRTMYGHWTADRAAQPHRTRHVDRRRHGWRPVRRAVAATSTGGAPAGAGLADRRRRAATRPGRPSTGGRRVGSR